MRFCKSVQGAYYVGMDDDQADRSGSIYSFGETKLAAERLRVVSELFNPTSGATNCSSAPGLPRPDGLISG
jgi:hypothetical protein